MANEETLKKAWALAADNMAFDAFENVDKSVVSDLLVEEMSNYLKKHDPNVTVDEIKAYVKTKQEEIEKAVSDYTIGGMDAVKWIK
jgi:hypothetical protein